MLQTSVCTREHTGSTEWHSTEVALCLVKEHLSLGEKDGRGYGGRTEREGISGGCDQITYTCMKFSSKMTKRNYSCNMESIK